MELINQIKLPIKNLRWRLRRKAVAKQYGEEQLANMPIVVGNAMPKSGSHLLHQILLGLTEIGPFVDPGMPPITRSHSNKNLSPSKVIEQVASLKTGDIAYGYFQALPEYVRMLSSENIASIFITRDPRDVLVSHVFYATDMYAGHGMHNYYNNLPNMEARLNAAILGVDEGEFQLSAIRGKYDAYLDWFSTQGVEKIQFEALILDQERSLGQIIDFLAGRGWTLGDSRKAAISSLMESIRPKKSGTFRGGRVGDWREHFSDDNKRVFKKACGDLLQELNYERDNKW